MKNLFLILLLAVGSYMVYSGLNKKKSKVYESKQGKTVDKKSESSVSYSKQKDEAKRVYEVDQKPDIKVINTTPKISSNVIQKNKFVKEITCNLTFTHKNKEIVPVNMVLYDYFVGNDGMYYFSAMVDGKGFLVKASKVLKEKCNKKELAKAFAFAKQCRSYGSPAPDQNVVTKRTAASMSDMRKSNQIRLLKLDINSAKESMANCDKKIQSLETQLSSARAKLRSLPRFLYKGKRCPNYNRTCPTFSESVGLSVGNNRSTSHKKNCKDQSKISTSRFYRTLASINTLKKKIIQEQNLKSKIASRLSSLNSKLSQY